MDMIMRHSLVEDEDLKEPNLDDGPPPLEVRSSANSTPSPSRIQQFELSDVKERKTGSELKGSTSAGSMQLCRTAKRKKNDIVQPPSGSVITASDRYDNTNLNFSTWNPDDAVVISGIAGRFPESDNVQKLQENLFNKMDLITEDHRRWKTAHPDVPKRSGKINNLDKFDQQFFGLNFKEVHTMDPMGRMLLEHAYEAILDAGVNPEQLRGTNTGVFIGACYIESAQSWVYDDRETGGYPMTGNCRATMANRISNWLGCTGPSYVVDTACSSSLFALDHAFRAIRSGECDSALVGGSNLCLHPNLSYQFFRLGVLSRDGRCNSFDADGDGYCRSEAVSVIYLQKSKDAKRIYAHVVYTKTNCDGYKEEGITYPSKDQQYALLESFYRDCGVPPSSLTYLEAHGTGTKVGDPVEASAIEKVFLPGRTTPLRLGSIKSNLGHTEPASGLCSVAKIIIAMETGYIPPNIHFNRPREGIKSLADGRMEVVTELTPWEGGYVGINSFGFGGGNAHVLLKSWTKEKTKSHETTGTIPRLVFVSGRTEEAVATLLDDLESRPLDVEYVSLLHNIHSEDISGHAYRGYTILSPTGLPQNKLRGVRHHPGGKRPVCFVFSGLSSQWADMSPLLGIPAFAKAIQKCDVVLRPYGIDVVKILKLRGSEISDNIINAFVRIAAIHIGLVDVLTSIGIVPDIIIGYSVGELGCAYVDGCCSAEQMILAAYSQGLAFTESKKISGSMAVVGLGNAELKSKCPPGIEIAAHNGPQSTTISGAVDSIRNFVTKLQAQGIRAEEVACGDIAYHSHYAASACSKMEAYLRKIIPEPKPRSTRWLSTSVPHGQRKPDPAKFWSPEYITNNIVNPVLFEETTWLIPKNATVIQIAPSTLLETILGKSLHASVNNIAFTNSEREGNVEVLLQALGQMCEVGMNPKLMNLYPAIEYPVSRGTPMISPLLRWDHSDEWFTLRFDQFTRLETGERVVEINIADETFEWMAGHLIDGRNLLPATGYLLLVWETVALMQPTSYEDVSVVFEDIRFLRATTIPKDSSIELTIMVQRGSGRFEVFEGGSTVVTGFIHTTSNPGREFISSGRSTVAEAELEMTSKDIYKELRLRGYGYRGLFQSLKKASTSGTEGRIAWAENWGAFMDNMLQIRIIGMDTRGLFVPTSIRKLVIDTESHMDHLRVLPADDKMLEVRVHEDLDVIVSGGVEIQGLRASAIARKKPAGSPVLEDYKFVVHRDRAEMDLKVATRIATHIALENQFGVKIKTIELIDDSVKITPENLTSPVIQEVLADLPLLQGDVNVIAPDDTFVAGSIPQNIEIGNLKKLSSETGALMVVGHGIFAGKSTEALRLLEAAMVAGGFMLAREPLDTDTDILKVVKSEGFDILVEKQCGKELVLLLRKKDKRPEIATVIKINNNDFAWLPVLQATLKTESEKHKQSRSRVLLVSEGEFESGLMGLVNCLRREPGGEVVEGLLIQDLNAPKFSIGDQFYSDQLKLGLALNVLRPGRVWGSYRFFAMNPLAPKPVYHARISQLARGDLTSMRWVEGIIQPDSQPEDIINIHYSSINFRDVMLGTGKLAVEVAAKTRQGQESVIGFEFSGVDVNGRPIMGMIESGALANLCICDREFIWDVPKHWSLEDAATVPATYGTAYYALFISGRMKKGDKVLIHAGSGGVGQAAITLALHTGCEVFTTVGTPEKRAFIQKHFPQIDDDHIGNSRDTSFEQLIYRVTEGRGVDIVLNSLAEDKLQASVRCLTTGGRFLEIGKFDLAANSLLGMETFLKGISFHGILLDNLFNASSDKKVRLRDMLDEGIKSGAIKPLVRTVFPMNQVEEAFRYMAGGKHIGKVILSTRGEGDGSPSQLPLALPRYYCSEACSYLILGGLGGFGLELADWLVLRGAKKLVLTSRTGVSNGYQRMRIRLWQSYGVVVVVIAGKDASTHDGCEAILKEAEALGPLDAIFNLAVVLRDALHGDQTVEDFEESFRVKAWATTQLDKLSRKLCPRLRQFVVFSSVSCGRGNAGQTNYGMANSVMERICEKRVAENLPGLAIQWGAVGDVGLVAEMQNDNKEVVIGGTLQQRITSCLQELDGFLRQSSPVVSSMVVAEKKAGSAAATNIVDAVVNIMEIKDLKTVSLHTPLSELGMDSMMAVEIKQTLEREFDVFLTAPDIRSLNFSKLIEMSQTQPTVDETHENVVENDLVELAGINLLLKTLGTHELTKSICVPLVTKPKNGRGEVFVLPGIEGAHNVFQSLVGKIKSPTTCLQYGTGFMKPRPLDDLVDLLIPHVKSKSPQNFAVVGYSFGSLVAIELVRRLEADGLTGRLVLIDGSPDLMKAFMGQRSIQAPEDQFQSQFLLFVMMSIEPTTAEQLNERLKKCSTWEEKLVAFTKTMPEKRHNFSVEEQQAILLSVYSHMKIIRTYDSSARPPIRTPITLLKPKIQSAHSISEDYGLSLITQGKVEIHYGEGDHLTILDDGICATAIDGELKKHVNESSSSES